MIAARQIFLGRGGGAKLPYDAEVEYLESTGTQWIDTGFKANTGTTSFEIFLTPKNISQYPQGLFGSRNTLSVADSSFNAFMLTGGAVRADFVGSARGLNSGMTANSLFVIRYDNRRVYVNGVPDIMSYAGNSTLQDYNFLVGSFTNGDGTPYSGGFIGLIRYVKLWSSGVLVRDMIPVRFTNEQGMSEGAMYDRVSKQLFRNQGTGAFLYGRDINPISARSYVNDGLVAMWDGIENAGWGTHDANATTWTELVSDTSVNISAYGAFTENAFSVSARMIGILGTAVMKNAIGSSVFTVECVFSAYSVGQSLYSWGNPQGFSFIVLNDYAVRLLSGGTVISHTAAGAGQSTGSYGIARNGLQATAYYGGQQLGNETTCAAIGMPTAGLDIPASRILHSIRFYSHALTAEEIAANYAVDKARFNLP